MMDGLIVQLLNEKWRTFIKFKFFQRMAVFSFYFSICLFALLLRGYYRLPSQCVAKEMIDKEENSYRSILIDRSDCNCHYTNFFRYPTSVRSMNFSLLNNTSDPIEEDEDHHHQYLIGLVSETFDRLRFLTKIVLDIEHSRWFQYSRCIDVHHHDHFRIFLSKFPTRFIYLCQ